MYSDPLARGYVDAFDAIGADPNNELIVATAGGAVLRMLQLTFIPYLTYRAAGGHSSKACGSHRAPARKASAPG